MKSPHLNWSEQYWPKHSATNIYILLRTIIATKYFEQFLWPAAESEAETEAETAAEAEVEAETEAEAEAEVEADA